MQPSPLGWRVYPGEQMHMYVPIRFLQDIPLLAQSSKPSSHSFWSGEQKGHRVSESQVRLMRTCMCAHEALPPVM